MRWMKIIWLLIWLLFGIVGFNLGFRETEGLEKRAMFDRVFEGAAWGLGGLFVAGIFIGNTGVLED